MSEARAFVPTCTHDVFVSYAHVDDRPVPGAESGWVTTLIAGLRTCLAERLGRQDGFSLWIDAQLSRHHPITDEILKKLEHTAVLLIVLSPGYVSSWWCRREAQTFLQLVAKRGRTGSVFVVERLGVTEEERPAELLQLKGYKFWVEDSEGHAPRTLGMPVPDPLERRYYDLLNDLGHDLANQLKNLRRGSEQGGSKDDIGDDCQAVFLAEVTDDLEEVRYGTRRYLSQMGLHVLPEVDYPRDPPRFRLAARKDLRRCKLFVQLLGPYPGKHTQDLPQGYVGLQHELAHEMEIPILQWRSVGLDLDSVTDPRYRSFLDAATVMASGIQEFRQEIVELMRHEEREPATPLSTLVFVDSEEEDLKLARQVCSVLEDLGVGYALPLRSGTPTEIRNDLKQSLTECDALLVVYGQTPLPWVRAQLQFLHRILRNRDRPLDALAVFEGPPPKTEPLGFKLPQMQFLDCQKGFDETQLRKFLASVNRSKTP
jgi:hypothetical protein